MEPAGGTGTTLLADGTSGPFLIRRNTIAQAAALIMSLFLPSCHPRACVSLTQRLGQARQPGADSQESRSAVGSGLSGITSNLIEFEQYRKIGDRGRAIAQLIRYLSPIGLAQVSSPALDTGP